MEVEEKVSTPTLPKKEGDSVFDDPEEDENKEKVEPPKEGEMEEEKVEEKVEEEEPKG